jgi:hypothetical protein
MDINYNKVIAQAALKLIKRHRELNGDIYDAAKKADYIFEDLQDEVADLVTAILQADDYGAVLTDLPTGSYTEVNADAKQYYSGINQTIQNLPAAIEKAHKQEQINRIHAEFNHWAKNIVE